MCLAIYALIKHINNMSGIKNCLNKVILMGLVFMTHIVELPGISNLNSMSYLFATISCKV